MQLLATNLTKDKFLILIPRMDFSHFIKLLLEKKREGNTWDET